MKKHIIMFFATGAYSGYSPFAPGTAGTIVAIPVAYMIHRVGPILGIQALLLLIAVSIYFSDEAARILGKKDPGMIVIDEIAGFCVAAFALPFTFVNIIIAFILFRIFDILKPPPVHLAEAFPGGTGIVMDDLVAGLYALIIAQLIIRYVI